MELIPLKSKRIQSGENLLHVFQTALESANEVIKEKDIIVIASKVLAYSQGLLVKVNTDEEFKELVKKESNKIVDEGVMTITMKNKILIPNAGIDNSNTPEGEVVLWPEEPFKSADKIRDELKEMYNVKDIGVVISDSHCQPLRMGTTGIAIGWSGFEGVQDEIGNKDLYDREMMYTKIAVADNLSSAANLEMGETNASIPFVIVRNANAVFTKKTFTEDDYFISPDECIYKSFYGERLK